MIPVEERAVCDDEVDAINGLRNGDISGLAFLVERYQLQALRLAYNLCGNRQVAEDAVAESFLAVQRYIASYDPSRPFTPWFYRIVINVTRSLAQRSRRLPTVPDARDLLQHSPAPGDGPEGTAIQSELERVILQHIDRLPDRQREAIVLRYYLDMDERTIARVLGVPAGTVKWRLFQARRKLRCLIEEAEVSQQLCEEGHRP